MKKIKILSTGLSNDVLKGESNYFLSKDEQNHIRGGHSEEAQLTKCQKGYRINKRCRCGYSS